MIYLHQKQELIDIKSVKALPNSYFKRTTDTHCIIESNSGLLYQVSTLSYPKSKLIIKDSSYGKIKEVIQHCLGDRLPTIESYILPLN